MENVKTGVNMKRLNDTGQMILVAGFVIGIGIVVLTIMLNNIVYASNTASEATIETNVFDYSNVVKTTTEAYEKAYNESNYGNDTAVFNAYMANYTKSMLKSYSLSGYIFTLQNDSLEDEVYFTRSGLVGGEDDWTLIERINYTDSFLLYGLNSSTLGNESNKFAIEAENQAGTGIWSVVLFNSSGNINVTSYNGSNIIASVNNTNEIHTFDITGNEINGGTFDFNFTEHTMGQTYSIKFINGSKSMGTFKVTGDLVNSNSFYIERIHVIESMMKLNKNGHLEINATIPITLPKGQT